MGLTVNAMLTENCDFMNKEEIQYIYSGRFDTAFLDELYADDIQTAAEILNLP
jgi:hypothetical protein